MRSDGETLERPDNAVRLLPTVTHEPSEMEVRIDRRGRAIGQLRLLAVMGI